LREDLVLRLGGVGFAVEEELGWRGWIDILAEAIELKVFY
jgi:hypothetical protein